MVLTDVTRTWLDLRPALRCADYDALTAKYSRFFLWTTLHFYAPIQSSLAISARDRLESAAGPFEVVAADKKSTSREVVGLSKDTRATFVRMMRW
ncbi:hypothetical protein C8J57DRAFT_1522474 [Mycena rebaudengoi]|nr:hypothetical protein C8J57DRAFT_1522474 [Mycena rebaudengoi]